MQNCLKKIVAFLLHNGAGIHSNQLNPKRWTSGVKTVWRTSAVQETLTADEGRVFRQLQCSMLLNRTQA